MANLLTLLSQKVMTQCGLRFRENGKRKQPLLHKSFTFASKDEKYILAFQALLIAVEALEEIEEDIVPFGVVNSPHHNEEQPEYESFAGSVWKKV